MKTEAMTDQTPSIPSSSLLVVDDHRMNRILLARYLARLGYRATLVENGRQALEHVQRESFDLILLDVEMPGMDGYQVLEQLQADPRLRAIPVIMLTALEEVARVVRCIELGAQDYLPRPFHPVLLCARVSACLEQKRLREQEVDAVQHVGRVMAAAAAVRAGTFEPESLDEVTRRPDALGQLALVFQEMARQVSAREQQLQQQVQQLRTEIEQAGNVREVASSDQEGP